MAADLDLREALAALSVSSARTYGTIQELIARIPRPGAGPAGVTTLQIVRKSSETTVQLSQSDEQYTVSETGAPVGAASPTNCATWLLGIDVTRH